MYVIRLPATGAVRSAGGQLGMSPRGPVQINVGLGERVRHDIRMQRVAIALAPVGIRESSTCETRAAPMPAYEDDPACGDKVGNRNRRPVTLRREGGAVDAEGLPSRPGTRRIMPQPLRDSAFVVISGAGLIQSVSAAGVEFGLRPAGRYVVVSAVPSGSLSAGALSLDTVTVRAGQITELRLTLADTTKFRAAGSPEDTCAATL